MKKLSIIIPVYNEKVTILETLRQVELIELPGIEKEIIIIDDGSNDGTGEILKNLENNYRVFYHSENKGKGAAIRIGFDQASGEIVIIQDADLEYSPKEYPGLLQPIIENKADIVYGSRELKDNLRFSWSYHWGARVITWLINFLYGSKLTDAYTCYKVFRTSFLKEFRLKSDGFEIEAELTIRALQNNCQIKEISISYFPRSVKEGKKINWRDGLKGVLFVIRQKFQWKKES